MHIFIRNFFLEFYDVRKLRMFLYRTMVNKYAQKINSEDLNL